MWGWLVVGVSGIIHILTANGEQKRISYVFKSLTLLSLIAVLFSSGRSEPQFIWVVIGLFLSLFSNILCTLPNPKIKTVFMLLLMTFVSYSKGFWTQIHGDIAWWLPALLFASSVIVVLLLLPKLDTIIFPVSITGLILVQMSWAASAVWMDDATTANLYGCLACLVFVGSTLLRAVNSYRISFKHAEQWAAGGFLFGQSLIVASVVV